MKYRLFYGVVVLTHKDGTQSIRTSPPMRNETQAQCWCGDMIRSVQEHGQMIDGWVGVQSACREINLEDDEIEDFIHKPEFKVEVEVITKKTIIVIISDADDETEAEERAIEQLTDGEHEYTLDETEEDSRDYEVLYVEELI